MTCFLCLCSDGQVFYCDAPPPESVMACFQPREDGQIMGLEILSIALGTFWARHMWLGMCAFSRYQQLRRVASPQKCGNLE